jgi:hypothetical protein
VMNGPELGIASGYGARVSSTDGTWLVL